MRRRAEPVNPEPPRVARGQARGLSHGQPQRAVADQPGAQQRCGGDVVKRRIDREAIALVGDGELGVAAVDLVAGEPGVVAQVFLARAAIRADAAGPAEPRHPDPVADREPVRPLPCRDHVADDLVPQDQRQFRVWQLAVDHMQIGAADRAGPHRDEHLPRRGMRFRQRGRGERVAGGRQQLRAHRFDSIVSLRPSRRSNASVKPLSELSEYVTCSSWMGGADRRIVRRDDRRCLSHECLPRRRASLGMWRTPGEKQ